MKCKTAPQKPAASGAKSRFAAWRLSLFSLGAFVVALGVLSAQAAPVSHGIAAGMIKVEQYPDWVLDPLAGDHDNTNVIATLIASINDFRLGTYNRGDLNVQIGTVATDDLANGILITCISDRKSVV